MPPRGGFPLSFGPAPIFLMGPCPGMKPQTNSGISQPGSQQSSAFPVIAVRRFLSIWQSLGIRKDLSLYHPACSDTQSILITKSISSFMLFFFVPSEWMGIDKVSSYRTFK